MSKYATIPEFSDGDAKSMAVSLRVMKQILETLTGQRQDNSKGAPMVYAQDTEPQPGRNLFKTGDFWINTNTKKLSYYTGVYWQVIG